MKMKRVFIVAGVAAAALAGFYGWREAGAPAASPEIVLYGNVDVRQVSLAFEESGRIAELLVEEGARVKAEEPLARLDTRTLALEAAKVRSEIAVREQALLKLRRGSRPQEIEQARQEVNAAQAEAVRTALELERTRLLWESPAGRAVSRQALDQAEAAAKVASAKERLAREALSLAVAGPRAEDVAGAAASLEAARSDLALLEHRISLGVLAAPQDAVVRSRLLEKGDMASAAKPVFTLALESPKWVRVYVNEKELGRVKPGMAATVTTDSAPERAVPGTVGFISSVSEFTPKSVQTEDLRTSLVYEARIRVEDPDSALRLGQPATVRIAPSLSETGE